MEGWIKLNRRLLEWEWFDDSHMVHLWVYLLMRANHEESKWHGISIARGSMVCSYDTMSAETGISVQRLRTCLQRLIECNQISKQSTNRFSIITICNYDKYQVVETYLQQASNIQATNNQQAGNKQSTNNQQQTRIIKNIKEEKEEKENNPPYACTREEMLGIVNEVWCEEYRKARGTDYIPDFSFGDHTDCVTKIADALLQKIGEFNTAQDKASCEKFTRDFFAHAYQRADDFTKKNWSLKLVARNFSAIYADLVQPINTSNNGNKQSTGTTATSAANRAFSDAVNALYDQMLGRK